VPQNVNFAIAAFTARAFLDINRVHYKTGNWGVFWRQDRGNIAEGGARRHGGRGMLAMSRVASAMGVLPKFAKMPSIRR
jgi:hypothetical protein